MSRRDLDLWEKEGAHESKSTREYNLQLRGEISPRGKKHVELGDTSGPSETGSRKLRIESRVCEESNVQELGIERVDNRTLGK